ncbi:SoxR reducing system RseC family protein [Aromatoleum toluclasticum]|uniref:SoxR reducing system RseC family protein n=1 Tax=Aromatoleum toluclasticum TaxID=92003 RepID=UPI000379D488|nr:SoxR reducing system RseC family protein [Aromatoleum toluclasticum]MCC4117826.1 SoxR reducing system RseC family protein [Aromatoleum toluclasticum]
MNEAQCVVERVEGGRAWVRLTERAGGCGRCDEPGGCRSTGLAYVLKAPDEVFAVPNSIDVRPGELVRLRMHDGAPLRGALLGYGLSVGLLLIGAALGSALAESATQDLTAAAGGLVGLAVAFGINRALFRSRSVRRGFEIEMVRGAAGCGATGAQHG